MLDIDVVLSPHFNRMVVHGSDYQCRFTLRRLPVRISGMEFDSTLTVWVFFRYFSFLQQSNHWHVRLIGDSKLTVSVSVVVCLICFCVRSVIDWQPVQGDWIDPELNGDGIQRGWMDGFQTKKTKREVNGRT